MGLDTLDGPRDRMIQQTLAAAETLIAEVGLEPFRYLAEKLVRAQSI